MPLQDFVWGAKASGCSRGHYEASLDLKETQELVGRLCEFVYVFCATSSTKISKRT